MLLFPPHSIIFLLLIISTFVSGIHIISIPSFIMISLRYIHLVRPPNPLILKLIIVIFHCLFFLQSIFNFINLSLSSTSSTLFIILFSFRTYVFHVCLPKFYNLSVFKCLFLYQYSLLQLLIPLS